MSQMEIATLAGGCFWCLEAVYLEMEGVTKVESGYMGGHIDNPTYEQVCGGRTGHAEPVSGLLSLRRAAPNRRASPARDGKNLGRPDRYPTRTRRSVLRRRRL